ncbi:MAG: amidohydrolase family protein [Planctomycetota bacterium]|nr:amidohydrolase family protein [Planctomycetota bacterium]
MTIRSCPAVDVHAHYGTYIQRLGGTPTDAINDSFMTADAAEVVHRERRVNVLTTIASPLLALLPRFKADAVAGNIEAARVCAETPGIKQYVVIDPRRPETYRQADEMLSQPQCVGIKIHPEEHGYPIVEFGEPMFDLAAKHKAIVLTHSGEQNSLPEDFIPFANAYPEMQLILAHIGCGWDRDYTHQIRAIQMSKKENVYADTSSMMSILPKIIEWGVSEVGADRILFGTDTPLYHTSMHRIRIEHANLSDADKRKIFRDNAVKLFGFTDIPEHVEPWE